MAKKAVGPWDPQKRAPTNSTKLSLAHVDLFMQCNFDEFFSLKKISLLDVFLKVLFPDRMRAQRKVGYGKEENPYYLWGI